MTDLPRTARGARLKADAHRQRAFERRGELHRDIAMRQLLAHRHDPRKRESVERMVDRALVDDPEWRTNVNDNQWWLAQAATYAGDETVQLLKMIHAQNEMIIMILREMRDDRRTASTDGSPDRT